MTPHERVTMTTSTLHNSDSGVIKEYLANSDCLFPDTVFSIFPVEHTLPVRLLPEALEAPRPELVQHQHKLPQTHYTNRRVEMAGLLGAVQHAAGSGWRPRGLACCPRYSSDLVLSSQRKNNSLAYAHTQRRQSQRQQFGGRGILPLPPAAAVTLSAQHGTITAKSTGH